MTSRKLKVKQAVTAEAPPGAQGAVVGYARTSTVRHETGLEAQQWELAAAGCGKVFTEQASFIGKRDQLAAALNYLREGDVLVVTKPDRLARSIADLLDIVTTLASKGIALRILSMSLDTNTPAGKLMATTLGAMVEFERALMLERQREGIARAKGKGRYKGRKPTARAKSADVLRLREAGMTPTAIAAKLGMSRASVYRIMVGSGVSGPDSATFMLPLVDADSLRLYAKQAGAASGASRRKKAADYAAELALIIAELDPDGSMTLGQLAEALTARKVLTMRGGPWSAVQVHRLKTRIEGTT
ncbi:recombinase family protein [Dankookia rubra]|uniref:Recombinase family protein n=1 Tax=Dankookia rubra TaxID=1442381 RepID=A0A4R5Q5W7_9PROT|nr:recombinase family protein [Dankookia rubra]